MFEAASILGVAAGTMQNEIDAALVGIRFVAASREQLDDIYRELSTHKRIKTLL